MTDAPTPLDLDAIRACRSSVGYLGNGLADEIDAALAEVARLRAEAARPAPAWDEDAVVEAVAREVYRRLHPGRILTHDFKRTPESDAREADAAYAAWDAGREGWAPGRTCREIAARVVAVVRDNQPVKPGREAVIEAMLGSDIITDDLRAEASAQGSTQREPLLCFADAVLDLLPGRLEAEVAAEALREVERAANHDWLAFQSVWGSSPSDLAVLTFAIKALDWLRARADRLAAEGGADRG